MLNMITLLNWPEPEAAVRSVMLNLANFNEVAK